MRAIVIVMMWYIAIGAAIGIKIWNSAIKYQREVEEEIGEEVNYNNLKVLVGLTIMTWPKTVVRFIVNIVKLVKNHLTEIES